MIVNNRNILFSIKSEENIDSFVPTKSLHYYKWEILYSNVTTRLKLAGPKAGIRIFNTSNLEADPLKMSH